MMDEYNKLVYIDKNELIEDDYQDGTIVCIKRKKDIEALKLVNNKMQNNNNLFIVLGCVISCLVIFSYIITSDLPELIHGIERWYNLAFQISIAYLVSSIFYYITVYIAGKKRKDRICCVVSLEVDELIDDMEDALLSMLYCSNEENKGMSEINLEAVMKIRKIDFTADSNVHDVEKIGKVDNKLKLSEYLNIEFDHIRKEVASLLICYNTDLSAEVIGVLEEVKHHFFHDREFQLIINSYYKVDFDENNELFVDYYKLIQKLKLFRNDNKIV